MRRKPILKRILLSLLSMAAPAALPAWAAEISVLHSDGTNIPGIVVQGEFGLHDGEKFATVAEHYGKAVVLFNSPGGRLIAGLQMGQIIRLKHFITLVPQGALCASACAFAWLAGDPRAMQPGSKIGFHAAFVEQGGSKVETGVGNALVGAYLDRLGLPMQAIIYVEQASPDDITWLDPGDARRIGIAVLMLRPTETAAREPPPRPPGTYYEPTPPASGPAISIPQFSNPAEPRRAATLEAQARSFAEDYFAHWSETNAQALSFFVSAYAKQVTFYGKPIDRALLLTEKRDYTERWPVRVYNARPDSLRVFCNPTNQTCVVSGIVDWDCRSPDRNAHSIGSANFSLTVQISSGREQVIAETGSVIARELN